MPIIIHRQDSVTTTGPAPTASNDWDKAVGLCVIFAGSFLLIRELTFAGDLAAVASWISGSIEIKPDEKSALWHSIGLFVVRGLAFGVLNIISGWVIWSKAKWAFVFAALLNLVGVIVQMAVLHDFEEECLAIGLGVAAYGIVRLCGGLETKN